MRRTFTAALAVTAILVAVATGLCGPSNLSVEALKHAMYETMEEAFGSPTQFLFGKWHGNYQTGVGGWNPAEGGWGHVTPNANDSVLTVQIKPDICLVGEIDISSPEGWTVDISNSPTANGYGGDAATTTFDSEFEFKDKKLAIYGNGVAYSDHEEYGEPSHYKYKEFLYPKRSRVEFIICDDKILITSTDFQTTNEAFHATEFDDGPDDGVIKYGGLWNLGPNDDNVNERENGDPPFVLYIGLNRTVNDPNRDGHGLVGLRLYALPSHIPGD